MRFYVNFPSEFGLSAFFHAIILFLANCSKLLPYNCTTALYFWSYMFQLSLFRNSTQSRHALTTPIKSSFMKTIQYTIQDVMQRICLVESLKDSPCNSFKET